MKTEYARPLRFAHRGLVQYAPENTLEACRAAVEHGIEAVEIDIRLSKDGEIICVHDACFTKMTIGNPNGHRIDRIRDLTWEEIRTVDIPYVNHLLPKELPNRSEDFLYANCPGLVMGESDCDDYVAGWQREKRMTHLCRFLDLDAWLDTVDADFTVEVEVKESGMMPRMRQILEKSKNCHRYILFSGSVGIVEEIQTAFKADRPAGLRLGANLWALTDEAKAIVERGDYYEIGLSPHRFTAEDAQWLRARGIELFLNIEDHPDWWAQMLRYGVKGFKTNYAEAHGNWWNKNVTRYYEAASPSVIFRKEQHL